MGDEQARREETMACTAVLGHADDASSAVVFCSDALRGLGVDGVSQFKIGS
jgi:hypothetical protein